MVRAAHSWILHSVDHKLALIKPQSQILLSLILPRSLVELCAIGSLTSFWAEFKLIILPSVPLDVPASISRASKRRMNASLNDILLEEAEPRGVKTLLLISPLG
jgi:hypothetical protein